MCYKIIASSGVLKDIGSIYRRAAFRYLIVIVDERVTHYRIKPGFKVGTCFELILIQQSFQQCFLNQIVSRISIAGKGQSSGAEQNGNLLNLVSKFYSSHL